MMPRSHRNVFIWLLVASSAGMVSCGGGGADPSGPQPAFSTTPEPAGMTMLAEQQFDCILSGSCPTNWFFAAGIAGAFEIVTDAGAPRSPSGVLQQNFTSVLPGGSSPGAVGRDFPDAERKRTLHASMWMKLSPNFEGHPSSINKAVFFVIAGNNRLYTMAMGSGSDPLSPAIGLQGLPSPYTVTVGDESVTGTSVNLVPNVGNVAIVRGVWHRYEVLLTGNTPGVANGAVEMWLDGTKIMQYAGIKFAASSETSRWEAINWGPTWGGAGGAITSSFYAQMDHMYVSGK